MRMVSIYVLCLSHRGGLFARRMVLWLATIALGVSVGVRPVDSGRILAESDVHLLTTELTSPPLTLDHTNLDVCFHSSGSDLCEPHVKLYVGDPFLFDVRVQNVPNPNVFAWLYATFEINITLIEGSRIYHLNEDYYTIVPTPDLGGEGDVMCTVEGEFRFEAPEVCDNSCRMGVSIVNLTFVPRTPSPTPAPTRHPTPAPTPQRVSCIQCIQGGCVTDRDGKCGKNSLDMTERDTSRSCGSNHACRAGPNHPKCVSNCEPGTCEPIVGNSTCVPTNGN